MEKSIKKLREDYEKALRDAFEAELQDEAKVVAHVRESVRKGIGALMGLRLDPWHDKWEISHANGAQHAPFHRIMELALTELVDEHRQELKAIVSEVLTSKSFANEIKSEFRQKLMQRVQDVLNNAATEKAERIAQEIIGDAE